MIDLKNFYELFLHLLELEMDLFIFNFTIIIILFFNFFIDRYQNWS